MNHHDPQNTGRSAYFGPVQGSIEWTLDANYMQSGISIGKVGDKFYIYLDKDNKLSSVDYSGNINWQYPTQDFILSTPLVANNGSIYFCAGQILYSLSSDGFLNWSFQTNGNIENMMTIGLDGVIYILDRTANLSAISSNGELLWEYFYANFNVALGGLTFSPDGNTIYTTGINSDIIAFDVVKKIIDWEYGIGTQYNSPMVDAKGNVYYLKSEDDNNPGEGVLNCLDESGSLNWKYQFKFPANTGLFFSNTPTIDKLGNIYFAYDTLFSVDYSGSLRWKQYLNGYADCPIVSDANSNIYVGIMSYNNEENKIAILKYSSDGIRDWEIVLDQNQVGGSPALTENHKLIFPTWRSSNIFLIQ
ncbi:MAG: hypothetical protein Kow0098_11970 [Ignavibacteriaceae bacterium]